MLMLVGLRWPLRHDPLQEEEEGMATQVFNHHHYDQSPYHHDFDRSVYL